ncbi:hypothetical protein HanHA300_Chr03g0111591 [Helianthus annuus]|nr:hypothetical protein HanHA300_Chr03g0111591 [Helianthus annuus]KAJ0609779.1 hypothetical protein HanHA89_Chr03g0123691 [Helianthus annuus]KAJ0775554.1 hypothetical protein HanOQP8_Chr03g0124111 [Helianthus annuus]
MFTYLNLCSTLLNKILVIDDAIFDLELLFIIITFRLGGLYELLGVCKHWLGYRHGFKPGGSGSHWKVSQNNKNFNMRLVFQGWCDSVGSVEEIQAKLIKRQEAAAKRERAMAYALAHQWQAGPKQQVTTSGFELDKSNWGWN